jgi:hypothetical protein
LGFRLDHVWLAVPDREEVCTALAAATGLPVLDAWIPGGVVRSRGVRFANGPFLDIHDAESADGRPDAPAKALLVGTIAGTEALAAQHGWACVVQRRQDAPEESRSPWSLVFFRRRQGVLSHLAVIDYEIDPKDSPVAEYATPLLALDSAPRDGAVLRRAWIGRAPVETEATDLAALGYVPAGRIDGPSGPGELYRGEGPEIALCDGEGVVGLDVEVAGATPTRIQAGPLAIMVTPPAPSPR